MKTKIQDLTVEETIKYLTEIGDGQTVNELTNAVDENPEIINRIIGDLENIDLPNAKWRGTEHTYGYVVNEEGQNNLDIVHASTITPDDSLKESNVNIKLGSLYTINYPGWGRHNVLMHFKCKHLNEENSDTMTIEFQQKFKSKEGEGAGDLGNFIFNGLKVPSNGLQFEVQTINVNNDGDEEALKVLEDDSIKNGLELIDATFSTLAPFTKMAQGVLGMLLKRSRNKTVQKFTIGFDFDNDAVDIAKLRRGTFIAVQVKRELIDWSEWIFRKDIGLIVHKNDNSIRLPLNHITFNVTTAE